MILKYSEKCEFIVPTAKSPILYMPMVLLQLMIVFLLLNRNLSINIGQKNTIDWDFRYDSRYSRRDCVVLSAETFSTRVMGRCRNNNPKDRQTTKDQIKK
jgi:hypothetical protein